MDRDTIIRLAREAAFHTPVMEAELIRFVALVAAHEREECAKVCEAEADKSVADQEAGGMYVCAAAIRSRT